MNIRGLLGLLIGVVLSLPFSIRAQEDSQNLSRAVSDFFQIYLLKEDRRSPEEGVRISGGGNQGYTAEIIYWHSLKGRDAQEELCNLHQWLFLGRGMYGKGATEVFTRFPQLKEVVLTVFDEETGTKLGKKRAEILPTRKAMPFLKLSVRKDSMARKNPTPTQIRSLVSKGKCTEAVRPYLDQRWFDENYLRLVKSST